MQAEACRAGRCYYVAHTHLAGGGAAEAEALFGRTLEHCRAAATSFKARPLAPADHQHATPSSSHTLMGRVAHRGGHRGRWSGGAASSHVGGSCGRGLGRVGD